MILTIVFIVLLAAAGISDAVTRKIPSAIPIAIAVLAACRIFSRGGLADGLIGFFALGVPMLLLAMRFGGLGAGDIKLSAACGLYLGFGAALRGLFAACLLALAAQFVLKAARRARPSFAFGPFLAAGYILSGVLLP